MEVTVYPYVHPRYPNANKTGHGWTEMLGVPMFNAEGAVPGCYQKTSSDQHSWGDEQEGQ